MHKDIEPEKVLAEKKEDDADGGKTGCTCNCTCSGKNQATNQSGPLATALAKVNG